MSEIISAEDAGKQIKTLLSEDYNGGVSSNFNSEILAGYIDTEVQAELKAAFGTDASYTKGLRAFSRGLARAVKKYLTVDVNTVNVGLTTDPAETSYTDQDGNVITQRHVHTIDPHLHKIVAP